MLRGFSPSRPPRGEGGGGVVDEKDFAPPTPHRFKPMPHGLPCSLNPLPRELPRCAVVGAWFQPFSHIRTRTVVSPLWAAVA